MPVLALGLHLGDPLAPVGLEVLLELRGVIGRRRLLVNTVTSGLHTVMLSNQSIDLRGS